MHVPSCQFHMVYYIIFKKSSNLSPLGVFTFHFFLSPTIGIEGIDSLNPCTSKQGQE